MSLQPNETNRGTFESIVDRFEDSWQVRAVPSIERALSDAPGDERLRRQLVYELVAIDLEYRWRNSKQGRLLETVSGSDRNGDIANLPQTPKLDDYLATYAELAQIDGWPVDLVAEEYRVRRLFGESPTHDEFYQRYPQHQEKLNELLANIDKHLVAEGLALTPVEQETDDFKTTFAEPQPQPQADVADSAMKQRIGDYEVISEIAHGGMGVVYKARQTALNRTVALKMIKGARFASDEEVTRFRMEAEAAANLDHPNIVPVYEIGQHEGQPYFSMALVKGESLASVLRENPLPPKRAAELLIDVSAAISHAHSKGVIHRDLKPGNIILDDEGHPKVTDFGLAKQTESGSELTMTGQVLGTPSYMPPEQASGQSLVGVEADVYSLGAVLYTCLTGRPPFQAASVSDTLLQVISQDPVSPRALNSKVDRDLETICLKCLEKESSKRYSSAESLREDLQRYVEDRPITARPISTTARCVRWCKRNPVIALTSCAAVVGFISVAVVGWIGYASTDAALTQSRLNEQQARMNLDLAEARFRDALGAVNNFYTRVAEETLLNQPGARPLKRKLLRQALAYYEEFLRDRRGDLALRDELVRAEFRIGIIIEEIESPEKSLPHLVRARINLTELVETDGSNLDREIALGDLLNATARVHHRLKHLDLAGEFYEKTLRVRRGIVDDWDSKNEEMGLDESRRKLANAFMNFGLLENDQGITQKDERLIQDAFEKLGTAQKIRADVLDSRSNDRVKMDIARCSLNWGRIALSHDQTELATKKAKDAVSQFEELFHSNPDDQSCQYGLAVARRFTGDCTLDWQKALQWYENAKIGLTPLAENNSNCLEYSAELARVWLLLGDVYYHDAKDLQRAKENLLQADKRYRWLRQRLPNSDEFKKGVADVKDLLDMVNRAMSGADDSP